MWQICKEALSKLDGRNKWIPLADILSTIRAIAGKQDIDEEFVKYTLLVHSIHTPGPYISSITGVEMIPFFESDGAGNFRLISSTTRIAERDLEDFLEKNLSLLPLDSGLKLKERQLNIGDRYIDLVGISENSRLWIIELKTVVPNAYDIEQLIRYKELAEEKIATGDKVGAALVAPEFSKEVKYLVSHLQNSVELIKFELNFSFENITSGIVQRREDNEILQVKREIEAIRHAYPNITNDALVSKVMSIYARSRDIIERALG